LQLKNWTTFPTFVLVNTACFGFSSFIRRWEWIRVDGSAVSLHVPPFTLHLPSNEETLFPVRGHGTITISHLNSSLTQKPSHLNVILSKIATVVIQCIQLTDGLRLNLLLYELMDSKKKCWRVMWWRRCEWNHLNSRFRNQNRATKQMTDPGDHCFEVNSLRACNDFNPGPWYLVWHFPTSQSQ
jgi:hypothetical protein